MPNITLTGVKSTPVWGAQGRFTVQAGVVRPGLGNGGILIAGFTATRSSITIPQTIVFDAASTTVVSSDANNSAYGSIYRQLYYVWDFGEAGQGSWSVSGIDMNADYGPIGAHTFVTAGVKTVTLTVQLGVPWQGGQGSNFQVATYTVGTICTQGGNTYVCNTQHNASASFSTDAAKWTLVQTGIAQATATMAITATDISDANTICVSPTANYTNAPAAATKQTTMPTAAQANGKKVLLHAGESGYTISPPSGSQGCVYGKYDSGANPVISNLIQPSTNGTNFSSFSNLAWGAGTCITSPCRTGVYNCTFVADNTWSMVVGFGDLGNTVPGTGEPICDFTVNFECFAVGNSFTGTGTHPNHMMYGAWGQAVLMGNTFDGATNHEVRITTSYQSVISHNNFTGSNAAVQDLLKFHAGSSTNVYSGAGSSSTDGSWTTSRAVISFNQWGSASSPSTSYLSIEPQNDDVPHPVHPGDEGIFDVLAEGNVAVSNASAGNATGISLSGRNLIARNNRMSTGSTPISISAPGSHRPPPTFAGLYSLT